MSSKLKPIDLTNAAIGATGSMDFNSFPKFKASDQSVKANIRILNESGCGLDVTFQASGNYHFLPAGGWGTFAVEPNDGSFSVTVTYTLPNPPVSQVNAIYYMPGEQVPQSFTLGNSPIGVGGTISVTNVSGLTNETTAVKTLVIDIGLVGNTLLYQLFSDGSATWSVINGGTAHTVIQVNNAGTPLQLGKNGDTTEVLGSLTVDQNETITGVLAINGAGTGITVANGSQFTGDARFSGAGTSVLVDNNATVTGDLTINGAGSALVVNSGSITVNGGNSINSTVYNLLGTTGNYGLYTNSLSRLAIVTGTGTGASQTITHGLGATPNSAICWGNSNVGTSTMGTSGYTSTQFNILCATNTVPWAVQTMRF
jgi:hypothetical protein